MKGTMVIAAVVAILAAGSIRAQQSKPITLDALQFMQGKWVGEGTSESGQGTGCFSFESALGGKAWIRRNHSEYPGTNGQPAAVHEDLMIVYVDAGAMRAFYTDTENHTISYRVSSSADQKSITFVSDVAAQQPRYRLTYVRLEPGHMTVGLESAPPDHPDQFKQIVTGRVRKVE